MKYQVVNTRTGQIVGTYTSKNRARNTVDRKDNEYGAYVHSIKVIGA